MKTIVSFLVSLLIIGSLVVSGCGQKATEETRSAAPSPGTAAARESSPGWKDRWEKTLSTARKEGKVVVYGDMSAEVRETIGTKFREKYGLYIEFVAGRSGEVTQKYQTETRAGLYAADFFTIGGGSLVNILKPNGLLASLGRVLFLPEVLDSRAWPDGKIPFLDKDGTMLPLVAPYTSYSALNTDMVKEGAVTSYRDFLKPEWKGKITLFDPTSSGAGAGWVTFVVYNVFGKEEGERYIRDFARQEPSVLKDTRTHVEWVARGKYPIGAGVQYATLNSFRTMGAPIKMLRPAEGGQLNPGGGILAMVARPAHPDAAAVLAHWLLSAEGQSIVSQAWKAPPVRRDVETANLDPELGARSGDKVYWSDEENFINQGKSWELSREVFGPLMK